MVNRAGAERARDPGRSGGAGRERVPHHGPHAPTIACVSPVPDEPIYVEGPHFVYHHAPELFLGRRGRGPLRVVWDTNVLIDYLTYGREIWNDAMPEADGDAHTAELEGLAFLMNLWVVREIELIVLPETVDEAKRKAPATRTREFEWAVDQTAQALALVSSEEECEPPTDILGSKALSLLPNGDDQLLVSAAHGLGAHVFLTRDRGVLRCRDAVAAHGLLILSPLDLLEELIACGAMHAVFRRETAYWPMPDLQRVSHLIQALPPEPE